MKFSSCSLALVFAWASTAEAFAPSRTSRVRPFSHQLNAEKSDAQWWGAAATALAGLTLASQIAVASIAEIPSNVQQQHGRFVLLQPVDVSHSRVDSDRAFISSTS